MNSTTLHCAYLRGQQTALVKLGLEDPSMPTEIGDNEETNEEEQLREMMEQMPPDQEVEQPEMQEMDSADAFAEQVNQDETESTVDVRPPETEQEQLDKPPNWGGKASLEGGDAGTRNMNQGLPVAGPV